MQDMAILGSSVKLSVVAGSSRALDPFRIMPIPKTSAHSQQSILRHSTFGVAYTQLETRDILGWDFRLSAVSGIRLVALCIPIYSYYGDLRARCRTPRP